MFGIGEIVGAVAGVGGIVWGFWKKKQLANFIKETFQFIMKLREVRDEKSAGGSKITPEELDEVLKEGEEALKAATPMFSRWLDKR